MTSKELHEAAAAMQEWAEQMADKYIDDDDDDPDGQLLHRQLGRVASTVLAEHAADDDEDVDEKWFLQLTGGVALLYLNDSEEWYFACDAAEITMRFERYSKRTPSGNCFAECGAVIKKRGQFRQLCRALGVKLKEVK